MTVHVIAAIVRPGADAQALAATTDDLTERFTVLYGDTSVDVVVTVEDSPPRTRIPGHVVRAVARTA